MRNLNPDFMKLTTFILFFIIGTTAGLSQELTLKINAGPSGISYKSSKGDGSLGFGAGGGIGYTHFFSQHWGLQTGLEVQYNTNSFDLYNGQPLSSFEIDDQGSAFQYTVRPDSYSEDQSFYSVSIPLMLQYRTPISDKTGIYLGLGGKVLFPGDQDIQSRASSLVLSGYYPDLNLEIDDLPAHGFGTLNNFEDKGNAPLKTAVLLSIEGGLHFTLGDHMRLYTGVYADYGLTDLQEKSDGNLVTYNPNGIDGIATNGVIRTTALADQSPYLSAGVQVKLGFDFRKDIRLQAQEEIIVEQPQVVQTTEPTPVETPKPVKQEKKEVPVLSPSEQAYISQPLVNGAINEIALTKEMENRLDRIYEMVKDNENVHLELYGHTCDLGPQRINQRIGLKRAQEVSDYLQNKGVPNQRLHVQSKGETVPLLPNTTSQNRSKNRRVEIKVLILN